MNICDAFVLLKEGKKVRKKDWISDCYAMVENKELVIFRGNGRPMADQKIYITDMLDDWEEYQAPITKEQCLCNLGALRSGELSYADVKMVCDQIRQYIERSNP